MTPGLNAPPAPSSSSAGCSRVLGFPMARPPKPDCDDEQVDMNDDKHGDKHDDGHDDKHGDKRDQGDGPDSRGDSKRSRG